MVLEMVGGELGTRRCQEGGTGEHLGIPWASSMWGSWAPGVGEPSAALHSLIQHPATPH